MRLPVCLVFVLLIFMPCTLLGGEKDAPDSPKGLKQQGDRVSDVAAPPSKQDIHITAPAGGERWVSGSVHRISWDASNLNKDPVKIGYRFVTTGTTVYFVTVRGNVGRYKWTLRDKKGLLPPGEYRILISGVASGHCTSSIPGHCQEGPSGASKVFTVIAPLASR